MCSVDKDFFASDSAHSVRAAAAPGAPYKKAFAEQFREGFGSVHLYKLFKRFYRSVGSELLELFVVLGLVELEVVAY